MNNVKSGDMYIYEKQLENLISRIDIEISNLEREFQKINEKFMITKDDNFWAGIAQESFASKTTKLSSNFNPIIENLRNRSLYLKGVIKNYQEHETLIKKNIDSLGTINTSGGDK